MRQITPNRVASHPAYVLRLSHRQSQRGNGTKPKESTMELVNLTPHNVNFMDEDGNIIKTIKPAA